MLEIDGSYGEGGGQVLRTSLSLSCLLGVPFRIFNIRVGRPKPGLQPQHLTCVLAAQEVTSANTEGAQVNSTSLSFAPTLIGTGHFECDVSRISPSAGSTSLILQTILPLLAFVPRQARTSASSVRQAHGPERSRRAVEPDGERSRTAPAHSTVVLKGGTHVPFSPVFEYIQQVFLPSLATLGFRASVEITKAGFYPIGGGEIRATVDPVKSLLAPGELSRGELQEVVCTSLVSRLPLSIAERQMEAMVGSLRPAGRISRQDVLELPSPGPGTCAFALARCEGSIAGFSSLGKRGKPAEQVGAEAADGLKAFLASGANLDSHLADQLLLWLCLAKGHFRAQVERVTQHLLTNLWVVKQFLPVNVEVAGNLGEKGLLVGEGTAFAR